MRPFALIDFEYNHPAEPGMGLLCCTIWTEKYGTRAYWLRDSRHRTELIGFLKSIKDTHVLVGYEIQLAEARCVAALHLNPNDFQWRDLFAEWRWLRNETNKYKYGLMVTERGFTKFTVAPARRKTKRMTAEEEQEVNEANATYLESIRDEYDGDLGFEETPMALLDALYYFEIINFKQFTAAAETKQQMHKLILTGTETELEARRQEILDYNHADIAELGTLADKMCGQMTEMCRELHMVISDGDIDIQDSFDAEKIQLHLGDWCARLAKYAQRGIPLNRDRLNKLLEIAPIITEEEMDSWNRDHPDDPMYRIGESEKFLSKGKSMRAHSPYVKRVRTKDKSYEQAMIKRYCLQAGIPNWPHTKKGDYSLDKKNLATYEIEGNLIQAYRRHMDMLSSFKAFRFDEKLGRVEALDFIGSDCHQRPHFNPHGAQTDRNGHKTKTFVPGMPHWLRILMDPETGMCYVECDFANQEVFIAAVLSKDPNLLATYNSNCSYVSFAQLIGMYPADLIVPNEDQREEEWFKPYKPMRVVAKTSFLALIYGVGYKTLANSIAGITGKLDFEQSMEIVDNYHTVYADQYYMSSTVKENYQNKIGIMLQNGWRLGPDGPSMTSVANLPVQGTGSCILQEACKRIDDEGIQIVATVHDSIIAYCKEEHAEAIGECMVQCMKAASEFVLGQKGMKVGKPDIIHHGDWWVKEKGKKAWDRYKKYFLNSEQNVLPSNGSGENSSTPKSGQ